MVCYTRGKERERELYSFTKRVVDDFFAISRGENSKGGHIRYGSAFWMELDFGRGFVFIITAATGQLCWFRGQDGGANGFWGRFGLL